MRTLFLTPVLPYPLDAGPKIRAYYTLRHLARQHQVTLLSFVRPGANTAWLWPVPTAGRWLWEMGKRGDTEMQRSGRNKETGRWPIAWPAASSLSGEGIPHLGSATGCQLAK